MQVVRRIAEEKENSQIVPSKPRTELQRIRLTGLYELLILLRIILTLNLQTGWIHQDELSNSIEVIAGDYFDLQVFKPDGFNSTHPTHSIALLHATIYFPYLIFNYFLSYSHPIGKEKIPNTKLLLLIPRLFHLVLSFLVDYILIKFCRLNDPSLKKDPVSKETPEENKLEETNPQNYGDDANTHVPSSSRPRRRRRRDPDWNRDSSDEPGEDNLSSTRLRTGRRRKLAPQPPPQPSPPPPPPPPPTNAPSFPSTSNSSTIRLVTLASSQVLLVFAPRSHPSSLNLVLFATLLYLVSSSFHAYDAYIPLLEKYSALPKSDGVGRVLLLKRMKASGYSPLTRVTPIAALTVLGVWNDPEFFLSYACIPLFFYLQRGISHKLLGMRYFHVRIFTFLLLGALFTLPLILWDSIYHGRVGWEDFRDLNLSPDSFVVTPVNYFARKTNQLRDWKGYGEILMLYLVVFNVLGVMGLVSFGKEAYDVLFAEWRHKPNLDSHWTFLNCSLFLPLFFLIQSHGSSYSVFDLAPLIFPLVYMHGHKIPLASRFSSKIGLTWFACNCAGVLYFGYLAQGGILTSFFELADNITPIRFNDTQVDITFSQMTAIPPTFTLAIPTTWKTILGPNPPDAKSGDRTTLQESNPLDLSSQTEHSHYNFKPLPNLDNLEIDPELPPTLYKTVLKLEQNSKVRVYHTGYSPLAVTHLERDLHRLVAKQEEERNLNKEPVGNKVSFLLLPYMTGRECSQTFTSLRLVHIKTYWNHVFLSLYPDEVMTKDGGGWRNSWKNSWKNGFHLGLSLYRMELERGGGSLGEGGKRRANNNTKVKVEEAFYKFFQFHDAFYDFLKLAGNFFTMIVTSGVFFTTYLVYLT